MVDTSDTSMKQTPSIWWIYHIIFHPWFSISSIARCGDRQDAQGRWNQFSSGMQNRRPGFVVGFSPEKSDWLFKGKILTRNHGFYHMGLSWTFHKWRIPKSWLVFVRENSPKMDDEQGTPISGNLHMTGCPVSIFPSCNEWWMGKPEKTHESCRKTRSWRWENSSWQNWEAGMAKHSWSTTVVCM